MMIHGKYIVDLLDNRDGGETKVSLSVIDDHTEAKMTQHIATFKSKKAAQEYADWMNNRDAESANKEARHQ